MAILIVCCAMFIFAFADVLAKIVVERYPANSVFVFRALVPLFILAFVVHRTGIADFRNSDPFSKQAIRAGLAFLEIWLFYTAIQYMSLGEALAYYLASPIYVILMSALVLRERLEPAALVASVVAFTGVLLIFGRGVGASGIISILPIIASLCFSGMVVMTRSMRNTSNVVFVVYQFAFSAGLGLLLSAGDLRLPVGHDLTMVVMIGTMSLLGFMLFNYALAKVPAGVVAPYQYTIVLWGLVLAFIIFGEVPSFQTLIGAVIIAVSGLTLFMREIKQVA